MRDFLSVLLCLMIAALAFADSGYKVTADHCKASKPETKRISISTRIKFASWRGRKSW